MALTKEKVNIIGEWFARRIKEDGADVKPVKHGRWEHYLNEGLRWKCSECDSRFEVPYNFCPHCGAKMEECDEIS